MKEKSFINHEDNGFVLNLPNGIRISTIFGWGSYSENHNYKDDKFSECFERIEEGSNDVEIMISCSDEKWLERINKKYGDGKSVIGYLTIEKWFDILKKCWNWKPKK